MQTAPAPTDEMSHDVAEVREFIASQLPLSAHLGGVLEAWNWDPHTLERYCTCVRTNGNLTALFLQGRVLRVLGPASLITPRLGTLVREDTCAIMGPMDALHQASEQEGFGPLRTVDVWETSVSQGRIEHVRVPSPQEIDSFAHASFTSFVEELGTHPVPTPTDHTYQARWDVLREYGRIVGVWVGDECVFRAEIRPVLGVTAELRGVWLAPDERGQGRAQVYLREVLSHVARHVAPAAYVLVSRSNTAAERLYERVGMTPVGSLGRREITGLSVTGAPR